MIGIQNRKKFISLLADKFDIAENEASFVSWKTGLENDFTELDIFILENPSSESDQILKIFQKSSKFQMFLNELQDRKETDKSFKKV